MHIHSFQHVPFEGLGNIQAWADSRGIDTTATRFFSGEQPPPLDQLEWLIVMGGPMGVHDDEEHPWLTAEKRFIEESLQAGKVILGICLGAQLLADVLGGRVYTNRHKEIGWFPIRKTDEADESSVFRDFPAQLDALHWHGDTFDIPSGAQHVFSSDACTNQAFVYAEQSTGQVHAVGLQFHLEMTPQNTARLVKNCADELVVGPHIQSADEILADPSRFETGNQLMHNLLDRLREETA